MVASEELSLSPSVMLGTTLSFYTKCCFSYAILPLPWTQYQITESTRKYTSHLGSVLMVGPLLQAQKLLTSNLTEAFQWIATSVRGWCGGCQTGCGLCPVTICYFVLPGSAWTLLDRTDKDCPSTGPTLAWRKPPLLPTEWGLLGEGYMRGSWAAPLKSQAFQWLPRASVPTHGV